MGGIWLLWSLVEDGGCDMVVLISCGGGWWGGYGCGDLLWGWLVGGIWLWWSLVEDGGWGMVVVVSCGGGWGFM